MTRCDDRGPDPERCLLVSGHNGWHKSNMAAWPNAADSMERWAEIGRRMLAGDADAAHGLSRKEVEYALDAAGRMALARGKP